MEYVDKIQNGKKIKLKQRKHGIQNFTMKE